MTHPHVFDYNSIFVFFHSSYLLPFANVGQSSSEEQKISKKKKTVKNIKKWNERNTSLLIDLLEERPSLWDILDSEYTKREIQGYYKVLVPAFLTRLL